MTASTVFSLNTPTSTGTYNGSIICVVLNGTEVNMTIQEIATHLGINVSEVQNA